MKSTEDKRAVIVKLYKDGMPLYELALKFYVTRATIYRWLNDEGVRLTRQKRGEGGHGRSSRCGMLAEKLGVSMPTARKYMLVLLDARLAGIITLEDLKKIGVNKARQEIVLAFLKEAGYDYIEEGMALKNLAGTGDRWLAIDEVVELFTDPGRFLNER